MNELTVTLLEALLAGKSIQGMQGYASPWETLPADQALVAIGAIESGAQCKFYLRVAPEMITIAGMEFEAPLREAPPNGHELWRLELEGKPAQFYWASSSLYHQKLLKANLLFATEGAAAAAAEALSSMLNNRRS